MTILSADNLFRSVLPAQPLYKAAATAQAAGVLHSTFYQAGLPGAATAPSPGIAGAALTTYAGQVPFPTIAASKEVRMAAAEFACAGNVGYVIPADRLWHNSALVMTTTGAQTVNSVALPARDLDGAVLGRGVELALEVTTVTGNGAPNTSITASYTNSLGVAGKTATIASFPATAVAGTLVPFALAAGDVGVQSVQSITLGTSLVSGAISAVMYRRFPGVALPSANIPTPRGPLDLGPAKWFDNSVPWLIVLPTSTALGQIVGSVTWAQG